MKSQINSLREKSLLQLHCFSLKNGFHNIFRNIVKYVNYNPEILYNPEVFYVSFYSTSLFPLPGELVANEKVSFSLFQNDSRKKQKWKYES